MIFIWANGQQVCHRIGSAVRGLNLKGQRPVDVLISGRELLGYVQEVGVEKANMYLATVIYPNLRYTEDKRET